MKPEEDTSDLVAAFAETRRQLVGAAPFGHVGPGPDGSPVLCKCGAVALLASDPSRCSKGHPVRGKPGPALNTGEHSIAFWREADDARREVCRAVITDAGHTEADAPRALALAADGIAQAVLLRDSAFDRLIEAGGPVTSAGRTRRAFTVWLAATDRLERHLRLVGLRRVPAPALTLAEYLQMKHEGEHADASSEASANGAVVARGAPESADGPPATEDRGRAAMLAPTDQSDTQEPGEEEGGGR